MPIETPPVATPNILRQSATLAPRIAQTLELLLEGGSEKELAGQLGLSRHTVHVYVKSIYRHYGVCSRAELMALFVRALLRSRLRAELLELPDSGGYPLVKPGVHEEHQLPPAEIA